MLISVASSPCRNVDSASFTSVPELVKVAPAPLEIKPPTLLICPSASLTRKSPWFSKVPPLTLMVPWLLISPVSWLCSVPPFRFKTPLIQMDPPGG